MKLEQVQAAVSGSKAALEFFVDEIAPVVHARVARRLLNMQALSHGRCVRQDVEDFVQEVFVVLFEKDAKVLRSWAPEKGLSLKNYVGLVAERHVAAALKTTKRSPWTESPTLDEKLESQMIGGSAQIVGESMGGMPDPETALVEREIWQRTLEDLRARLSPLGRRMFEAIVVNGKSVEEICAEFHMGPDAVYAWRSRMMKRVRESFEKTLSERSPRGTRPLQVGHD